jgi:hypothetical protein
MSSVTIIDPLSYLGDTPEILYKLVMNIANNGKESDFNELELKTLRAIQNRDCLTKEEMTAMSSILKDVYRIEIFITGKYLDGINDLLVEANQRIYEPEVDKEIILKQIFREGVEKINDSLDEQRKIATEREYHKKTPDMFGYRTQLIRLR